MADWELAQERKGWPGALVITIVALIAACCASLAASDTLVEGFRAPPESARPRVWWQWMNGNVTEDGARLDLEWMRRIGIGGVQNFDAAFEWGSPFDTPPPLETARTYLTPQWRHALRESVVVARGLGLEFAIASSPGWSGTGGPWVKPHQAMKKLVWSETRVRGGRHFEGRVARPPATTGLFQNIPLVELGRAPPDKNSPAPGYYADVATIAYRVPRSEYSRAGRGPAVTSSAGSIDVARLSDGDLAQTISLPCEADGSAWIQFSFGQPQKIQALTAVIGRALSFDPAREAVPGGRLEASEDGRTFRRIVDLPRVRALQSSALQQTVSFAPTRARVFRVVLDPPKVALAEQMGLAKLSERPTHRIAELILHTAARVNRFEDKAGYSSRQITGEDDTPPVAAQDVIRKRAVLDLTSKMRPDGSLDWIPPAGEWVVLRFGYSLTGRITRPASRPGTGLEVDKLNRKHVRAYLNDYLGEYERALGAELMGDHGLQYVVTDSYEAGPQNWTDDMLEQFRSHRGYDPLPWLPVMSGRVVESAAASDRFLWDFRKTLGDLVADAHYGELSAALERRGLGRYGQSHESGRAFIGDGMDAKKTAAIPMGAMWAGDLPAGLSRSSHEADIRESASVAHIYGKPFVAAESFTASTPYPYSFAPSMLKQGADRELALGVNRFVIHTSVHQPDSRPGPGIGLGPFGQWFTRKETWAAQAGAWIGYLARSSYLLQQGRFVADIAYLYGEDTNVTSLSEATPVTIPGGHDFDFVSPAALISEFSFREDMLVTRTGMRYRVLALDGSTRRISVPVLRKLRDLIRAGAVAIGARPVATPSLADDEREFRAIVAELWGESADSRPAQASSHVARTVGRGQVIADHSLAEALALLHIAPDVVFPRADAAELRFLHRELDDGDLYFVSTDATSAQVLDASFRVTGRSPELWRADTGTIAPLSYHVLNGRTIVPLRLEPYDAIFVLFRATAAAPRRVIAEPIKERLASIHGAWNVRFPSDLGAPARARFDTLSSWTESADPGVRYFSGTAGYEKRISISREWLDGRSRIELDLGKVAYIAEVIVNGDSVAMLWKEPFRVDMTSALQVGDNHLEIRVTNLWPNRLIGDKQPGARKIAFATFDPFTADSPLLPSGLLGPVTLWRVRDP